MSNPEERTGSEKRREFLSDHLQQSSNLDKDNMNNPDFQGSRVSTPRSRGSVLSATTASTTASSSSSSSGSISARTGPQVPVNKKSESHHSTESSPAGGRGGAVISGPSHRRPHSVGSQSSFSFASGAGGGRASVTSPQPPVFLPAGNIFPSGRVVTTGMASPPVKTHIVGSGSGVYGHGSIISAGASKNSGIASPIGTTDRGGSGLSSSAMGEAEKLAEKLADIGDEHRRCKRYTDALKSYDRAFEISPLNAPYHCKRASILIDLNRFGEALKEYEETIKLFPNDKTARHDLGRLLLRLGEIDNARIHLYDSPRYKNLQNVETRLTKCVNARKAQDWNNTFNEAKNAMDAGADKCLQLLLCRAEAQLKQHKLRDPDSFISDILNLHMDYSQSNFFGINSEAYLFFVRAKLELAMGRFENALAAAEEANQIDPQNVEVSALHCTVKAVTKARKLGNDLFMSGKYTEASSAYGEGLLHDPSNSVLYCNRAACFDKLCQYERSVEDCDQALLYLPNYGQALLRRAHANCKLERWAEAVRDYEVLRRTYPKDGEIAESLFQAQVALKKSRRVSNLTSGGKEVELVYGLKYFQAEISSPGASVVHFLSSSNIDCKQISPVLDKLCAKYPSINFLKVDIKKDPEIADAEEVTVIPTIRSYKKGRLVKEIVRPSPKVLESFVKSYCI